MKTNTIIRARRGAHLLGLRGPIHRRLERVDRSFTLGYEGKDLPAAWAKKRAHKRSYLWGVAARTREVSPERMRVTMYRVYGVVT